MSNKTHGGSMGRTCCVRAYTLGVCIALLSLAVPVASAGPYEDGVAAYKRGDFTNALRLLRPLAARGNTDAQASVAFMYGNGQGTSRNVAEALKWYRLAADQGEPSAQFSLGAMYAKGEGVTQSYAEMAKWYAYAANQGYAAAQYYYGRMYSNGEGVDRDHAEAMKWFRMAAAQGYPDAEFGISLAYVEGRGIAANDAEAVKWCHLAASHGLAIAQYDLGYRYETGHGVDQDFGEAAKWYRMAAAQGLDGAQYFLGVLYRNGRGVPRDYDQAVKWYLLAANQGMAAAQFSLGFLYANGEGVVQNYAEAAKWFRRGAARGDTSAQYGLGLMYAKGQGVAQDFVSAHKWFNLSALGGKEEATKARSITEKMMTNEQITLAQQLASACRASNYDVCGEPDIESTESVGTGSPPRKSGAVISRRQVIPLQRAGGTFVAPILVNNTITLSFVIDSGAADVAIPADVVRTLMRSGTLKQSDFRGERTYVLADGSKVPSRTFLLRSMKVGNRVLENVLASVTAVEGSLLLGQSFLSRFQSWSIDNGKQLLLLE